MAPYRRLYNATSTGALDLLKQAAGPPAINGLDPLQQRSGHADGPRWLIDLTRSPPLDPVPPCAADMAARSRASSLQNSQPSHFPPASAL
ncbi:hypothetical protein TgHK011_002751 [Trichoderma gracile]|nr:hypothetical protein TgHK011_002751 [Trichoderma gracile]